MFRILIVDDDGVNRLLLRRMLEGAGYEVDDAANGRAALEAFTRRPTDVVLTDIVMPDHEGLEMIRALRRRHTDVKIVAMSGAGEGSHYLTTARLFGAARTLAKPFSKQELLDTLAEVLCPAPPLADDE